MLTVDVARLVADAWAMEFHERVFAHRAYDILHDADHRSATDKILGIPNAVEYPGARWPGFLGSRFVVGQGAVAIANVHREFRSDRMRIEGELEIEQTVSATRALQLVPPSEVSELDFAAYLDKHRAAYLRGLSGGWKVGRDFRVALDACGVPFTPDGIDSIAYMNWSCCQVPEDGRFKQSGINPKKVKIDLRSECGAAHPVSDLLRALSPEALLTTSCSAFDVLSAQPALDDIVKVCFHQIRGDHYLLRDVTLAGQHFRAVDKPSMVHWAPALKRHLARLASPPTGGLTPRPSTTPRTT